MPTITHSSLEITSGGGEGFFRYFLKVGVSGANFWKGLADKLAAFNLILEQCDMIERQHQTLEMRSFGCPTECRLADPKC